MKINILNQFKAITKVYDDDIVLLVKEIHERIDRMPDNPNIKRMGDMSNCFTISIKKYIK